MQSMTGGTTGAIGCALVRCIFQVLPLSVFGSVLVHTFENFESKSLAATHTNALP
jgi:hypothetical protein